MVLLKVEDLIKDHVFEHRNDLIPEPMRHAVKTVDDFDIDLTDYFDMVAGTSIGSLIATYIANRGKGAGGLISELNVADRISPLRPGSMETVKALFENYGDIIFPRNIFTNIKSFFMAKYSPSGLEKTLKLTFGDTTMEDLDTGLLVTSYDAEEDAACSFLRGFFGSDKTTTYTVRTRVELAPRLAAQSEEARPTEERSEELRRPDQEQPVGVVIWDPHLGKLVWKDDLVIEPDTNYYLRDITRASSAAPTLFPPARITRLKPVEELTLIDGGVVAINPILQALTYIASTPQVKNINDAAILSLGCGSVHVFHNVGKDPGLLWWLTSGGLLEAIMSGTSESIQGSIDYWIYKNLKFKLGQYMRIQKAATTRHLKKLLSNSDNVQNLPELEDIGHKLAEENNEALKIFIKEFIFAK